MQGVIYNIVRDSDVAEEVMQDVFIKAWQNASSYSSEKGRFFTWILNIARNAAIDKTRSKAFKKSVGLNGVGTKAVNALSDIFIATAYREGELKTARFEQGNLISESKIDRKLLYFSRKKIKNFQIFHLVSH